MQRSLCIKAGVFNRAAHQYSLKAAWWQFCVMLCECSWLWKRRKFPKVFAWVEQHCRLPHDHTFQKSPASCWRWL